MCSGIREVNSPLPIDHMSPVDVSDGSGAGNTAVNDDCEGEICEIHDFPHFRKK